MRITVCVLIALYVQSATGTVTVPGASRKASRKKRHLSRAFKGNTGAGYAVQKEKLHSMLHSLGKQFKLLSMAFVSTQRAPELQRF